MQNSATNTLPERNTALSTINALFRWTKTARPFKKLAILFSCAMLLSSCASFQFDTNARLKFVISEAVNPDSNGRPSPVVINLLFLNSNRQFAQEDLISLMQDAEERLGKDLINMIRLKEFIPGEVRTESFDQLAPEITHIGIVTEYIQYQDADAKQLIEISPESDNDYIVRVNKLSMSLKAL
ncbi:MAG: type VI secretion system lipoprotein TssJ [Gammaproteobacteria bacterium]|nr:MAG: type VI secretion system lipoprotein TssJ [Pseudomonadota bacterium]PIE38176.1 MAG: type VI secretion system lipoprotein TssJ [Gammaproteobacteria bacterium]